MSRLTRIYAWFLVSLTVTLITTATDAAPIPKEYREAVRKGLEYLAKSQKDDGQGGGYWEGNDGQFRVALTALAGMALSMEGSTMHSGRYSKHITKTVRWLKSQAKANHRTPRHGLIGGTHRTNKNMYMFGHGYAVLFLANIYGDDLDKNERDVLKKILTQAVQFIITAQTPQGGWFHTSAKEGAISSEPATTIPQVQALLAVRNVGIAVPRNTIRRGQKYVALATVPTKPWWRPVRRQRNDRLGIIAAALFFALRSDDAKREDVKKWLRRSRVLNKSSHKRVTSEYTDYYYAKVIHHLGDKGWAKLIDPNDQNPVTWTGYRKKLFDRLVKSQSPNGSWNNRFVGPVYSTAVYSIIMQLDNLPISLSPR
ncbi:MAG: prenyltransferase/squalene oxidase repeat-containing protein [Gemmataceae bacterium]